MAETPAQLSALRQFSEQLASVVEHAARSIVTVAARPRQPATGIIWRADTATIILTADHVIEREDAINVTLPDNRAVRCCTCSLRVIPGVQKTRYNAPFTTSARGLCHGIPSRFLPARADRPGVGVPETLWA